MKSEKKSSRLRYCHCDLVKNRKHKIHKKYKQEYSCSADKKWFYKIDTRYSLDRADVPSLTPDDPSLHLVIRKADRSDRIFNDILAGITLNCSREDLFALLFGIFKEGLFDRLDLLCGVVLRLLFELLDKLLLCLVLSHSGNPFELFFRIGKTFSKLRLLLGKCRLGILLALFDRLELTLSRDVDLITLVDLFLAFVQTPFALLCRP